MAVFHWLTGIREEWWEEKSDCFQQHPHNWILGNRRETTHQKCLIFCWKKQRKRNSFVFMGIFLLVGRSLPGGKEACRAEKSCGRVGYFCILVPQIADKRERKPLHTLPRIPKTPSYFQSAFENELSVVGRTVARCHQSLKNLV